MKGTRATRWAFAAVALMSLGVCAAESAAQKEPLMMMRFRATQTASDVQWNKTFAVLKDNRGACDEVWFSTDVGVPEMKWHRDHVARLSRYAAQCREAGIVPSVQIQATLGHSDDISELSLGGMGGKSWTGFTGRGGLECRNCNCPRQEKFLDYMREMARLYASFRPSFVWIDDDLRITGHRPGLPGGAGQIGCWCKTCIAAFNAETGRSWTRETLDAAMGTEGPLFERWRKFSIGSIAGVARVIAEAVHSVAPETRLGYQHCGYSDDAHLPVFRAMYEATGLPVGARPGGGYYYDYDPNSQIIKCLDSVRTRRALGNPEWIHPWCPEVETCPRAFAARTAQGLLNEVFASLALGLDSVSLFIMSAGKESDEWYSKALLKPLSAERPFFDEYMRHNAGTLPAGIADRTGVRLTAERREVYRFALSGVPVLTGPGKAYGEFYKDDLLADISELTSAQLLALRRRMDERSGGTLPVFVETPSIGIVVPHVAPDGSLRSVAILNARIDRQEPLRLRLRKVSADAATAVWREMRGGRKDVAVSRDGNDAIVEIPSLSAWNWGWLAL